MEVSCDVDWKSLNCAFSYGVIVKDCGISYVFIGSAHILLLAYPPSQLSWGQLWCWLEVSELCLQVWCHQCRIVRLVMSSHRKCPYFVLAYPPSQLSWGELWCWLEASELFLQVWCYQCRIVGLVMSSHRKCPIFVALHVFQVNWHSWGQLWCWLKVSELYLQVWCSSEGLWECYILALEVSYICCLHVRQVNLHSSSQLWCWLEACELCIQLWCIY